MRTTKKFGEEYTMNNMANSKDALYTYIICILLRLYYNIIRHSVTLGRPGEILNMFRNKDFKKYIYVYMKQYGVFLRIETGH